MCGRFAQYRPIEEIATHFRIRSTLDLPPRYNIAPSQQVPVVRYKPGTLDLEMVAMRWGLVPHWAGDIKIGSRMINARAETLPEKPSFREAYRNRRCLIPAAGFYEWKRQGSLKQAYYIQMKPPDIIAFAGLWEAWKSPEGEIVRTFTIVTTEANTVVSKIHDRMPVIIQPESYQLWLSPAGLPPREFLRPYSPYKMMAHPVSGMVNNPGNDGPGCIRKVNFS